VKPARFEYHAPTTVEECLTLLAEYGDDAKVLAGGQSLVPMLALRLAHPEHLLDVNRIDDLSGSRRDNGSLVLGATTRHVTLERDPGVAAAVPLLTRVAPHIGHFQIRNRGTIGGSLAHADPAAELPGVVRLLDALIEVDGPSGGRSIPAADFFETVFTTALEPEELLTAVRFPLWGPRTGFTVEQVARRHGDFALVGALAAAEVDDDGRVARAALCLTGVDTVPVRREEIERSLIGAHVSDLDLVGVGADAMSDLSPSDDVHASSAYRKQVGATLASRALGHAIQEAMRGAK
jgi:carbon-monoxide dehydrogenase medium subunit